MTHRRRKGFLKITDYEIDAIRQQFDNDPNPPITILANMFNVSKTYINDILKFHRRHHTLAKEKNLRK